MTRTCLAILLFLTAIGCGPAALAPLPEQVRDWKLEQAGEGSPRVYRYAAGESAITVTVHEYASETVAFEAFQKWRIEPGTMPFYKGRRLFVPASADRPRLTAFVNEFQPLVK